SSSRPIDGVEAPKNEWFMVRALDSETGKTRGLMSYAMATNVVYGEPQVRVLGGETYAFLTAVHFPTSGRGRAGLFKVKLSTGKTFLVEPGSDATRQWVAGPDGLALAALEWDGKTGDSRVLVQRAGEWKVVAAARDADDEDVDLIGLGRSGGTIMVAQR